MRIVLYEAIAAVLMLNVCVLTSEKTPFPISEVVELLDSISIHRVSEYCGREYATEVVLDYSYSPEMSRNVVEMEKDWVVLGMYADFPFEHMRLVAGAEDTAEVLAEYLRSLQLTAVFLATTVSPYYLRLAGHLKAQPFLSFPQDVCLPADLTYSAAEQFVGRVLKPSGQPMVVLLVDEATAQRLQSPLQEYHVASTGYVYFLSYEAAWSLKTESMLYLVDSAAVNATSRVEYEALILADRLNSITGRHFSRFPPYSESLIFIRSSQRSIYSSPFTSIPISGLITTPHIPVSVDLYGLNFDGRSYPDGDIMTRGMVVAYNEANYRKDLLPHFQFINYTVGFGGSKFNSTWAIERIHQFQSQLGIIFHSFGFSNTVLSVYNAFVALNLTMPMTSTCTTAKLSDPDRYPMFLRTITSSVTTAGVILSFVKLFGWTNVAVVYSNSLGDLEFGDTFVTLAGTNRIEVTNSRDNRLLPTDLSTSQQKLNLTVQEILSSTTRILIIGHVQSELIIERLYDFGAKAGEYQFFLTYGLSYTLYSGSNPANLKRLSLINGAFMFYDRYFSGPEGPKVKQKLIDLDGNRYNPLSCVHYDNVMLTVHAVDYMLAKGGHYEEPWELVREMRTTRFGGCAGVIQIEPGGNDRRPGDYSLLNAHADAQTGSFDLVEAIIYSPTKVQLFTPLPVLRFADGSSTSFPDSWTMDSNCPYFTRDIRGFPKGTQLAVEVGGGYLVFISVLLIVNWKINRKNALRVLRTKQQFSLSDGVFILYALIEYFQFLSIGAISFDFNLSHILNLFCLNILLSVDFRHGVFEAVVVTVGVGVVGYLVLMAGKWGKVEERWTCCEIGRKIERWAGFVGPIIGGIGYFPVTSVLLSAFVCDRAVGDSYTESLLYLDCHVRCWNDVHIAFATVAAVLLLLYSAVTLLIWPIWQENNPYQHVKIFPFFYRTKTMVQTILIVSSVSVQPFYPTYHSVIYCVVVLLLTVLSLVTTPTNYPRCNLWVRLLLVGLGSYACMGVAHTYTNAMKTVLSLPLLTFIFTVLGVTGVVIQCCVKKYRSLLRRVHEDRYDIIKFAFTWGTRAQEHLSNFIIKRRIPRMTHSQRQSAEINVGEIEIRMQN